VSFVFDVHDETVWSPSSRVGRLYVDTAETLSRFGAVPSGLVAIASDMYELDPITFPSFVRTLLDEQSIAHPIYTVLIEGFVLTSGVMMERGGIGDDAVAAVFARFPTRSTEIGRAMPRL